VFDGSKVTRRNQPGQQLAPADSHVAVLLGAASRLLNRWLGIRAGGPGTLSTVSPAEMDVWAETRAGGAASTPI
jgi:hypothetical protein